MLTDIALSQYAFALHVVRYGAIHSIGCDCCPFCYKLPPFLDVEALPDFPSHRSSCLLCHQAVKQLRAVVKVQVLDFGPLQNSFLFFRACRSCRLAKVFAGRAARWEGNACEHSLVACGAHTRTTGCQRSRLLDQRQSTQRALQQLCGRREPAALWPGACCRLARGELRRQYCSARGQVLCLSYCSVDVALASSGMFLLAGPLSASACSVENVASVLPNKLVCVAARKVTWYLLPLVDFT